MARLKWKVDDQGRWQSREMTREEEIADDRRKRERGLFARFSGRSEASLRKDGLARMVSPMRVRSKEQKIARGRRRPTEWAALDAVQAAGG